MSQLGSSPSDIQQLIATFRIELVKMLGRNLIGIYLFGSIAFPGFEPRSGDIDFYVLVRRQLTPTQMTTLNAMHLILSSRFRFGKALDGEGQWSGTLSQTHANGTLQGTITITDSPTGEIPTGRALSFSGTWTADF